MQIAVVAPPFYEVPPARYGGTELVCHGLVEGLVRRGHEVTLLATGRSTTSATYVATAPEAHGEGTDSDLAAEVTHVARAAEAIARLGVDVVHDHTCAGPLLAGSRPAPTVVTVHGDVSGGGAGQRWAEAIGLSARPVAISRAQQRSAPSVAWAGVVHNGIAVEGYPLREAKDGFALYLGRFSPVKGVHHAIAAAQAAGRPIVLAGEGTVPSEVEYFEREVRPRLGRGVEWVGPVGGDEKLDLLGRARCLLFPACWPEPFGLAMVEALACGTPVVGLRAGAVPEVVTHGVTGLLCDDPSELPAAIDASGGIRPARCREDVQERFSAERMAAGYEAIYQRAVDEGQSGRGRGQDA